MKNKGIWVVVFALFLPLASLYADDSGPYLYRYKNENGVTVLDHTIPPEYVDKGYTVLTTNGRVVRKVPPALDKEQRKALMADKRERHMLHEMDQRLLRTFSGPKDAIRARDRKVEALENNIRITLGNIKRLEEKRDREQEKAARFERAGKEIPADIIEALDSFNRQIDESREVIRRKEEEKEAVFTEYQPAIERLEELTQTSETEQSNSESTPNLSPSDPPS